MLCVIMGITWVLLIADFGSKIISLNSIPISHKENIFYIMYDLYTQFLLLAQKIVYLFFLRAFHSDLKKYFFFSKNIFHMYEEFIDRFMRIHFLINFFLRCFLVNSDYFCVTIRVKIATCHHFVKKYSEGDFHYGS